MVIAIDTNVLSAVLTGTKEDAARAEQALGSASREARLLVSAPVFAELTAIPGADEAYIETFLNDIRVDVAWTMTEATWRSAATAYRYYAQRRRQSAVREGPRRILADFLIGAHAMEAGGQLLTFDAGHYRSAFPELTLLT